MRNDLQFDLCEGCGTIKPMGIIPTVIHVCPLNTYTYRSKQFTMRSFHQLCSGIDALQSFKDLLYFPYMKKMLDAETASPIDKIIYSHCRDADIQTMKRLRSYIELEEEFDAKY